MPRAPGLHSSTFAAFLSAGRLRVPPVFGGCNRNFALAVAISGRVLQQLQGRSDTLNAQIAGLSAHVSIGPIASQQHTTCWLRQDMQQPCCWIVAMLLSCSSIEW
jgi:hypothetical protein